MSPEDREAIRRWEHSRSAFADSEMVDVDMLMAEGEAAYREAAKRFLTVLNSACVFIATHKSPGLAVWQVIFGAGLQASEGISMDDKARELGVTRAAISQGAKIFQRGNGLPQSEAMRDSAASCAAARERQLGGTV